MATRGNPPRDPRVNNSGDWYQMLTKTWAANAKLGPLQDMPPQHLPKGPLDISATMMGLPAGNGHPMQRFMAFTTTYPNGEVEIRLVRQFPPDHP